MRSPEEYGQGHIPGAINVWIESPQFANRAGLFATPDAPVVLVVASPTDLERAAQGLGRIGLDAVAGTLQWGMTEWKSQGLPVATVPQISVHDLATMKDERPDLVVIDVREPFEWDEGHIEGALHVPMGEALARKDLVPDGRPKAVLCAGGLRSSARDQRARPRRAHRLVQRHRWHDRLAEGRATQHGEAVRRHERRERLRLSR